jgi:hypothetical protein
MQVAAAFFVVLLLHEMYVGLRDVRSARQSLALLSTPGHPLVSLLSLTMRPLFVAAHLP